MAVEAAVEVASPAGGPINKYRLAGGWRAAGSGGKGGGIFQCFGTMMGFLKMGIVRRCRQNAASSVTSF